MSTSTTTEPAPPETGAPKPRTHWALRALMIVGAVVLVAFPVLPETGYYQTIGIQTLMLALAASAWNIMAGYTGYVSLGQSAFIGVGAYTTALLANWWGIEPILLAPLGGITAAIVAALLALVTFRARGHAFVIISIGFLFGMETLAREWRNVTGGAHGIQLPLPLWARDISLWPGWEGDPLQIPFYYLMLVLAVLTVALSWWIRRTKLGAGLLAIREDEDKAAAVGIRTPVYKMLAFAASAAPIGIAGGIYISWLAFGDPTGMFNIVISVQIVLAGVLGGRGTLWGPVLGGFVVAPLNEWTNREFGGVVGLRHLIFGAMLIAVVILLPKGVVPTIKEWLEKRRAARHERPHIEMPVISISEPAPAAAAATNGEGKKLLELDGVHKRFGGLTVLEDCSFAVREGTITGLIGPNGSGKTTAFNLITGMLKADQGEIRFDGKRIDRLPPWERHTLGLGRTFQITRLFKELTVMDNLVAPLPEFSWQKLTRPSTDAEMTRAKECLDLVGMTRMAGEKAGTLSFGQQKLVEFAQVLMLEPKVILLDEPAGGVNPRLIDQMVELIREVNRRGITFLVVEHNMPMVLGLCDPVVVLARGKPIAEGTAAAIQQDPAVLEAYLGGDNGDDAHAPTTRLEV